MACWHKVFFHLMLLYVIANGYLVPFIDQVDAVRDPEGARAELGIPGALTSAPEPQWEEEAQRILEILGLKGKR